MAHHRSRQSTSRQPARHTSPQPPRTRHDPMNDLCDALERGIIKELERNPGKELTGPLAPWHNLGKVIPRHIDCFLKIDAIIIQGLREEGFLDREELDDEMPEPDPSADSEEIARYETARDAANYRLERRQREINAYKAVLKVKPQLKIVLEHLLSLVGVEGLLGDSLIPKLCETIKHGMTSARTADTAKLKKNILDLCENENTFFPSITAPRPINKSERGFNHIDTGRLLCPARLADDYNSELLIRLKQQDIDVTANDLPLFLYDGTRDPTEEDMWQGLCRGYVMISACHDLLFGNGIKLVHGESRPASKEPIAVKFNITSITPGTIAYTACQVRFALSSLTSWGVQDGSFSTRDFFYNVLWLFEDNEPWASDTLMYWNNIFFNSRSATRQKRKAPPPQPAPESDMARMKKARNDRMRKEREQRLRDSEAGDSNTTSE